jgi:hypothetical protein
MVSVPFPKACEFARAADLVAVPARPTLVCPLFGEIFLLLAGEKALEVSGASFSLISLSLRLRSSGKSNWENEVVKRQYCSIHLRIQEQSFTLLAVPWSLRTSEEAPPV